ncbi:MAG: hypothetical protein OHK0039_39510 [Bacteroidia bacterium]
MLLCIGLGVVAQPHSRPEDHFWRKRVVNRINLVEKINRPLVLHESQYYAGGGRFTETEGMVASLINGLKTGKYVAYDPDNWDKTYSYTDLLHRMRELDEASYGGQGWDDGYEDDTNGDSTGFDEAFDEGYDDLGGATGDTGDTWEVDADWGPDYDQRPDFGQDPQAYEPDLAPYEEFIHIVEDWIFDKTRSTLFQKIEFVEIIWADPGEVLPEQVLARFRWDDVRDQLDRTMWKSRFNDAESRSIAEVFDMRLFHAYPISIGGEPIRTLQEAELRRRELIEFEHHLWNY